LGHKNAIKHKKEDFLDFLTNPTTPLKEFENDCASFTKFKKGAPFVFQPQPPIPSTLCVHLYSKQGCKTTKPYLTYPNLS
jgi:hypothetical protein